MASANGKTKVMSESKRAVLRERCALMKQQYGKVQRVGKDRYVIPLHVVSDRTISDPSVEFFETWPEPGEIAKAIPVFPDELVEVRNMKDSCEREIRKFRVTRVISPFRFHADYDVNHRHRGFRHWKESFQTFYTTNRDERRWKLTSPNFVGKYRCYAHYNADYDEWERVRVCRQNHLQRVAEVFVCDYPSFKIVTFDSLRELHPEFSKWPAQGFRMYLVHIRPCGSEMLWSKEAVDLFKSLVRKHKSFKTAVLLRSETRFPDGFPDYYQDTGVVMVPLGREGPRSIQGELIKAGFAIATGLSGGYPDMLYSPESEPKFTLRQLYMADPSLLSSCDVRPAIEVPTKEEGEKMIERVKREIEYEVDKKKPTIEEALHRLVAFPDLSKRNAIDLSHLPKGIQHKLAYVRMCHINNPGVIFVQLHCQLEMLKEMEFVIGSLSSTCTVMSPDDNRIGLFITTSYQTAKNQEPSWVRGIVIQVGFLGKDVIKILVIDHGVILTLKREYCRYLPDYFKTIPAFAHRIHVDFSDVVPYAGKTWSADASEVFRKYIQSWESQEPLYYLWRPGNHEPVELEDIQQIVQYDSEKNRWEAGVTKDFPNSRHCFKEVGILKHLYYSFGVEMVFEIVNIKKTYLFQQLNHVLLEGGFCIHRKPPISPPLAHRTIVRAMNNAYTFQRQLKINNDHKKQ